MSTSQFQTSKPALAAFIKTFGDAAQDFAAMLQPGETIGQKLTEFENLIPDAMADATEAGDVKAEVANLQPQDYADAATLLVQDCNFESNHAQSIVKAVVAFLQNGDVNDIWSIVVAVKTVPAAA